MKKCFECKATEDVQEHHVVPASRGGTQTVPLCSSCHGKAHGRDGKGMNHSRLVTEGIKKKFDRDPESRSSWGRGTDPSSPKDMERGRIARGDKFALENGALVYQLREQGLTYQKCADTYVRRGFKTSRGKNTWNTSQVRKLFLRYKKLTLEDK